MAKTQVSDVIVPEIFVPYVIERTAQKSRLIQSGIIVNDPEFDELANEGGRTVNMPFWQDLAGDDEVIADDAPSVPAKIGAIKDVAARTLRVKSWKYNDLSRHLSGSDPASAIGELVASFKARRMQSQLLSTLTGIFGSATMSGLILDRHITSGGGTPTSDNILDGASFLDAKQLLGDNKDTLTGIMMHSAVENLLLKLDLIDYIPDSEGKSMLKTFQGLEVIVDDNITTETVDSKTVYSSFLFGNGAFAQGNTRDSSPIDGGFGTWEVEFAREALDHDSIMMHRWGSILHPRGIKWTDNTVAGATPSNAELATAANWSRVYELKNVRIIRIRTNILA